MKVTADPLVDYRNIVAKLDPRTKIALTITISTILISSGSSQSILRICLSLFSLSLLLSIHKISLFIKCTITFLVLILIQNFVVPYSEGMFKFVLLAFVGIFMNMFPGFIVGYYTLFSTKISEFIAAMEKMKLPRNIIIPISVIFRFFPTIAEEYRNINYAMKMRGITFSNNFLKMIEYRMIPLIISVVQIGNDLSFTAMTRGVDSPYKRTNICVVRFKMLDIFLLIVLIMLWIIYFKEKLFND
ncbi:energy-coupling factor transporter transmembrane protein EcfT [Staphylococcus sp. 18_1_E_LY]|uniref:Energy-coupling factor transporter transmembrane protein EcfT n=1 Tax=Staphylococcus lloydii TaxID=2781774 RepID=A0A7T1F9H5_9STAP|nr:energy-coupling factor transporter transmembrane component T [Staphylococcus lloydii]MBF7019915.1 energy-coupling factor transporter transmembrane protein EcfT [Staphylococcus lloydii]MBF7027598.1 energy-coupling factor transporter transmembrane protein EcfT [Staphylococcus lloydii]QPM75285.1 energy-coupling factor transporter transmembrane protein EcfT [Staphylococcus lloydii]